MRTKRPYDFKEKCQDKNKDYEKLIFSKKDIPPYKYKVHKKPSTKPEKPSSSGGGEHLRKKQKTHTFPSDTEEESSKP